MAETRRNTVDGPVRPHAIVGLQVPRLQLCSNRRRVFLLIGNAVRNMARCHMLGRRLTVALLVIKKHIRPKGTQELSFG